MFCKEYKFIAFKDIDGEKCPQVWVELYCDNDPNTLPTNGVGIDNFPKSYDPDYPARKKEQEEEEERRRRIEDIQQQVASLKAELASTDYKLFKYIEGWISEEEYAPIKAERQRLRDAINALEN